MSLLANRGALLYLSGTWEALDGVFPRTGVVGDSGYRSDMLFLHNDDDNPNTE